MGGVIGEIKMRKNVKFINCLESECAQEILQEIKDRLVFCYGEKEDISEYIMKELSSLLAYSNKLRREPGA